MLKPGILAAAILISSGGFSQHRQRANFHLEGFAIKTDALALLNSVLSGAKGYALSGELYFNNEYSFNADASMLSYVPEAGVNKNETRWGGHARWYFMQDYCNCSAFYGGIFFTNVHLRQTVGEQYTGTKEFNYLETSFEGGLCGGYEAILAEHFVIDPSVQTGLEFYKDMESTELVHSIAKPGGMLLLVHIMLGIGYRF